MKKKKNKQGAKLLLRLILFATVFFILSNLIGTLRGLGLAILLTIFYKIVQIKKRKYFWLDKNGKKLKFKEFLSRWKNGVQGITPLQQDKMNLMGIWITITGILAGIIVNALVRLPNMWWWIEIILVGSLILTSVQFLGILQKYITHKKVEETMKELNKKIKKK